MLNFMLYLHNVSARQQKVQVQFPRGFLKALTNTATAAVALPLCVVHHPLPQSRLLPQNQLLLRAIYHLKAAAATLHYPLPQSHAELCTVHCSAAVSVQLMKEGSVGSRIFPESSPPQRRSPQKINAFFPPLSPSSLSSLIQA